MTLINRKTDLVKRYKKKYHIPAQTSISDEMIFKHWELEKTLTKKLLESTAENRREVFIRCYTRLYSELDWLNKDTELKNTDNYLKQYGLWAEIIGKPPKTIYEIGSGKGELISFLANKGYKCKGTEITRTRGANQTKAHVNLSWGVSDGVHLYQFEEKEKYDVVISNHVIEHMHPEDLFNHFVGVRKILKNNGRYIFSTPHRHFGPSDISRLFECDSPKGMHLKEYFYSEIKAALDEAGFVRISAVLFVPIILRSLFGNSTKTKASQLYLSYLCMVEKMIASVSRQMHRRKVALWSRLVLFRPNIFIVASKGSRI